MLTNNPESEPRFLSEGATRVLFHPASIFAFLGIALLITVGSLWYGEKNSEAKTTSIVQAKTPPPFTLAMPLFAKAAYVYDPETGDVLFARSAELQLPLASLTKLMTALVASNKLADNDTVVINDAALREDGASGLEGGERWSFKKLLGFTLVSSSNDGAHALASAAGATLLLTPQAQASDKESVDTFVANMNAEAKRLGMSQTYFLNPTGLDESVGQSGAYGSADDIAHLMAYILKAKPELLSATPATKLVTTDQNGEVKTVKNTNTAIGDFPGLIASKTGYTDLAGGNLAIAFDAGLAHPIIIVVLGSTEEGRFIDAKTLLDATLVQMGKREE